MNPDELLNQAVDEAKSLLSAAPGDWDLRKHAAAIEFVADLHRKGVHADLQAVQSTMDEMRAIARKRSKQRRES